RAGQRRSLFFGERVKDKNAPPLAPPRPSPPAETAPAQAGLRFVRPPSQYLLLSNDRVGRTVQVSSRDLLSANPRRTKQIQQGRLRLHVKQVIQFLGEVPYVRLRRESLASLNQCAVTRKPDPTERPQTQVIEERDLVE